MQQAILKTLLATLLLTGCNQESTESGHITNDGLYAEIDIEETGSGSARVVVELNVGGNNGTNVNLSEGEWLEVAAEGNVKILDRDTDILDIDYEARINVSSAPVLFRIDLFRTSADNILDSYVELPEGFQITSPAESDILSTDDVNTLEWTPLSDPSKTIDIRVSTECKNMAGEYASQSSSFEVLDNGSLALHFGSLVEQIESLDRTKNCLVDIYATRDSRGSLSPSFGEGGSISATRTRNLRDITLVID